MKNISKVLTVVAILVFLVVFISKDYNINRLILTTLGIVILVISYISSKQRTYVSAIIYALVCLLILYAVDTTLVYTLKTKPIFSSKITSSDKFITYDSLIYRQFECNKKIYFDLFYKKSDYCSFDLLEEKDINTLSSDIVNNFNKYRDKFYIIDAKISHKEGNDIIELKSYDKSEENINGNVIFNDNITYTSTLDTDNIDKLKVYDNVKIVARIARLKKENDGYKIILKDSHIYKLNDYKNFKINVVDNKSCEKDKTEYVSNSDYNYYTSCLSNVYVVYDEDVYELSYVLKDEKINLKDLIKNYDDKEEITEEDDDTTLYKFDKYNILVCNSNNIIIGNKKLALDNNYCNITIPDENEL